MSSVNLFYVVTLILIQMVTIVVYTFSSPVGIYMFPIVFLIALGIDYIVLYTAGEWADSFMERYFFILVISLIFFVFFTLFTEGESRHPIIAEFQHNFRYLVNNLFSSFGYDPAYKNTLRPYSAGCFKGEPGCDCQCACEGLGGANIVYCNGTSCSCSTQNYVSLP
jgi:hypothetical protein